MRPASSVSAPSIASSTATGRTSPAPRRAKPRSAWVIAPIRSVTPTISPQVAARLAGLAGVEQPAAGLGIGADRRQRLVDLVRDPGRDLAEDRQPVGLGELVAQPPRPGLRRLALGDLRGERGVGAVELLGARADAALELGVHRRQRRLPRQRPAPAAQEQHSPAEREQQPGEQRRQPARCAPRCPAPAPPAGRSRAASPAPTGRPAPRRRRRARPSIRRPPVGASAHRHRRQRRVAELQRGAGRRLVGQRAGSCRSARRARWSPAPRRRASVTWTTSPLSRQRASSVVELDLDHHDAERPEHAVDPARQVEPRPAADGAERVLLRRALGHRLGEVGAEAVVAADEALRRAGVAGRDGDAVAADR